MSDDLVKRLCDRRVCSPAQNSCRNDFVLDQAADRIEELEAVLREVDAWVDDLGLYAQEGHEPATVFKRVKEVLNK